jgi:hypothetical protein
MVSQYPTKSDEGEILTDISQAAVAAHAFERRVAETQISKSYVLSHTEGDRSHDAFFDKMGISLKKYLKRIQLFCFLTGESLSNALTRTCYSAVC